MMRHARIGVFAAAALLASACAPNLDVPNLDEPDLLRVLATPEDVKGVAASALNSWYIVSTEEQWRLMFDVTSDHLTCNFGNFGMRFNNLEPRDPYQNLTTHNDRVVSQVPWEGNYGALGGANDAMKAFKAGVVLATAAETDQYKTLAMFAQAGALTNLALIFDKAFVVDENTTAAPALVPYTEVTTAAMAKWDAVIAASAGKTYVFPSSVLPLDKVTFNGTNLNRIANTMAARTMVYSARTQAETNALNWAKVLAYADKGITGSTVASFDVTVVGDANVWYAEDVMYGALPSWLRVDQRTINMMDPSVPAKFTSGNLVGPGPVHDNRLGVDLAETGTTGFDYVYVGYVIGTASRGPFMQSPYAHTRYYKYTWDADVPGLGPQPFILAAENDLIIAEALARTNGDLARAATLINKTRVTRGGLVPATAGDGAAKLLTYIAYEHDIELTNTGTNGLYARRRIDGLQPGTIRHLPVPAKELETLGLPRYTFGGASNLAGK